jgi:hypothetical protein
VVRWAQAATGRVAAAHCRSHWTEELSAAAKGEMGLGHYEERSWVGWHHHMTPSLQSLWLLQLEKGRLGEQFMALMVLISCWARQVWACSVGVMGRLPGDCCA